MKPDRLVDPVVLRRPHLVLADAGDVVGVGAGGVVDRLDDVLGQERVRVRDDDGRVLELEVVEEGEPVVVAGGLDLSVQVEQHLFDVADDRDGGLDVLADLGRVDVYVDDLRLGREVFEAAGDAVVEAHADADEEVGLADRDVAPVHAVHAGQAEVEGMGAGEAAEAEQRGDDRYLGLLRQLHELVPGAGDDDAVASHDYGSLRLSDELGGGVDLLRIALQLGFVAGQVQGLRVLELAGLLLDIARDVDEDGTGAARGGDVERLFEGLRNILDVEDELVVLGDRDADAGDVGLLEAVAADEPADDGAGDADEGHGVHPGVGDAGYKVSGAGTGGRPGDAGFAGDAGVGVGGVTGGLLVPDEDVMQLRVLD